MPMTHPTACDGRSKAGDCTAAVDGTQPPPVKALTARQQRFVQKYVVNLNATQAAIRAGYSAKGARVRGAKLLANRNVQKALESAMEHRRLRTQLEADDVVRQLAIVASANVTDYVKWTDGQVFLLPSDEIAIDKLVAVHSVTSGPHGVTIRMHDKIRALELLAKHLGMFSEGARVDLEVRDGSGILARLQATAA